MYTVLWIEYNDDNTDGSCNIDRWSRCESRREVAALLIEEGLENDPDVLIFGPDADDCVVDVADIFSGL